ncbi:hypothetical protein SAMN06265360_1374 [Haloechinothrix alba]|uniref:Protein phosphatase 2C n=2 Tax=Haloechinothrix alba TaxID=664784 RepID=A0A239ADQ8_9PSEU|nr:hypothetical protein SAMN06265360_1374 [Haloechinothrix alba]
MCGDPPQIATAQVPPIGESDDKIFTTDHAVIVLDGASAFVPVELPASTYADRLGRELRQQLTAEPRADLAEVLYTAIEATAHEFDLRPGESPSSTVAIARARARWLDVLVLGDTDVITPGHAVKDVRIDALDLAPRRRYRERLAAGTGYDDEHRRLLRELQHEQAKHRNREGGYWIAEAAPEAAKHALTEQLPASETPWAILVTDGAYEVMEHLDLDDWPQLAEAMSSELEATLRRCHTWEQHEDPDARSLPRAKRHDDKSIATIQCQTSARS